MYNTNPESDILRQIDTICFFKLEAKNNGIAKIMVPKIKVKYIQTSTYLKGVLQESLLKTYKKDEVNSMTHLIKKGNGYTLDKDGEVSYINDIINRFEFVF